MRRLYPMMFVMSVLVLAGSLSAGQFDNSAQNDAGQAKSGLPADGGKIETVPINIIAADDILKISFENEIEAIAASIADITVSASAMLFEAGYDGVSGVVEVASDVFDLGSGDDYAAEGYAAGDFQVDPDVIATISFADSTSGIDVPDIGLLDIFGPAY